jgi:uncharacterized DUF497 family protein
MNEIRFEWDGSKSRANKRKHGVSFEEAQTVFLDENAVIRIISARKADRAEEAEYWNRR